MMHMNNLKEKVDQITEDQASELVTTFYGLKVGHCQALAGEVDHNFRMVAENQQYLLKISRPETSSEDVVFQTALLDHLHRNGLKLDIPIVLPTKHDKPFGVTHDLRLVRLHSWVDGIMLADVNPMSERLLKSWGRSIGHLSTVLQDFDHPLAHRFYKWNPSEALHSKKYRDFLSAEQKDLADYFWDLFEREALPCLASFRKSVNYNDAHIHNLLCAGAPPFEEVTGVIDFGDALFCETINELAIACAYAGMNQPNPLEAIAHVVQGYHAIFAITEAEVGALFALIGARLTISVANAAYNKHLHPENQYLVISEKPAWEVLRKLRALSPALVHYSFRAACGLEPCPKSNAFKQWMRQEDQLHPVISLDEQKIELLDLSVGSLSLGNHSNYETVDRLQACVNQMLYDAQAQVGVGGYAEVRPFYSTDAYQITGNDGSEWRTVHLGIDIWSAAGTPVHAPCDGVIYSAQDNAGERNYGPTIIMEHAVGALIFYTLYGHLSLDSLSDKCSPGSVVKKGQEIGRIGAPPENGNWPPHLHFQILLDILDQRGDFPGVAFPRDQEVWQSLCPNPNAFFGIGTSESKYSKDDAIIGQRSKLLGSSLSVSYEKPLHIVRGAMQYLYDERGQRYLDTVNNVPHVGHQHPRIVRAAQQQLAVLNTNTRYLHKNILEYAEELLKTLPPE